MGIDISSPPRVDVIPWFEASLSHSAIPISFYQFALRYINTSTFVLSTKISTTKKKHKRSNLWSRKIEDRWWYLLESSPIFVCSLLSFRKVRNELKRIRFLKSCEWWLRVKRNGIKGDEFWKEGPQHEHGPYSLRKVWDSCCSVSTCPTAFIAFWRSCPVD